MENRYFSVKVGTTIAWNYNVKVPFNNMARIGAQKSPMSLLG